MTSNLIASRTYDAYDSIVLRLVDKLVGNDAHSRTSVQQMDPTNVQYNKKEKKVISFYPILFLPHRSRNNNHNNKKNCIWEKKKETSNWEKSISGRGRLVED